MTTSQPSTQTNRLGSLHWIHWLVVTLSLILTLVAWQWATVQQEQGRNQRFTREAQQVVELVQERMVKYEDALWGGVAMREAMGEEVSYSEWLRYANSLEIDQKYPGIHGLGFIFAYQRNEIPKYLEEQRRDRPDFKIHPLHGRDLHLPITYIEPEDVNRNAVGLDMSHEIERYTGAIKARDTGTAQITAPIVLVQDEQRSPGFLFFAPCYGLGSTPPSEDRESEFTGLVYAPFVAAELMAGTLSSENRQVGIRIDDGENSLYDEHHPDFDDYDPNPQFSFKKAVTIYGRQWVFDIRSTRSFRVAQDSSQPLTILLCGLLIDAMLIGLFTVMSRSNQASVTYADKVTKELKENAQALEDSNRELERFAYVASHDLQEPVRMVGSFAELLESKYKGQFDETGERWLEFMVDGAKRMRTLVKGLLEFSSMGREKAVMEALDVQSIVETILHDLQDIVEGSNAVVSQEVLPAAFGHRGQIAAAFQNLISNALKFHAPDSSPRIHIGAEQLDEYVEYSVRDNGIGIDEEYAERVFVVFQRLHTNSEFGGTGIGLAITLKVAEAHGGKVWFESNDDGGTTFYLRLPGLPTSNSQAAQSSKKRQTV